MGIVKPGAARGILLAALCSLGTALMWILAPCSVAVTMAPAHPVIGVREGVPHSARSEVGVRTDLELSDAEPDRRAGRAVESAGAPGPFRFRVRLLDAGGTPLAGTRLRAWVHDRVWLGDAVCDGDGIATLPDPRGLRVRIAPRQHDASWSAELGSSTYDVVEVRVPD